jgi:hypothetical protein
MSTREKIRVHLVLATVTVPWVLTMVLVSVMVWHIMNPAG